MCPCTLRFGLNRGDTGFGATKPQGEDRNCPCTSRFGLIRGDIGLDVKPESAIADGDGCVAAVYFLSVAAKMEVLEGTGEEG